MPGSRRLYTMSTFTVAPGRKAEFIEAWKDASAAALVCAGLDQGPDPARPNEPEPDRGARRLGGPGHGQPVARLPEVATFASKVVDACDDVERYTLDVVARATREVGD